MSKKRTLWSDEEDAQLSQFADTLRASRKLRVDGKISAGMDGVFEFAKTLKRPGKFYPSVYRVSLVG